MLTPDEHAREAERLLALADEFRPGQAHAHGLLLKAQVHATLSLSGTRAPRGDRPAPRKKPGPKPGPKAKGGGSS